MGRLLLIAYRNLVESPRRSLLLGGAIMVVTLLLVLLMALSGGVQETILRSATAISTGHVNVGGYYKPGPGVGRPVVTDYPALEALVRERVPELDFLVRRVRGGFDQVIGRTGSLQNAIIGIEAEHERLFDEVLTVLEGDLGALSEPGTALLFKRQATELEVVVGDSLVITGTTARGVRNSVDVRVAAIADDLGIMTAFSTFVNAETARGLYQLRSTATGVLMLYLRDRGASTEVAERLRAALDEAGHALMLPESKPYWQKQNTVEREDWTGQRLDVTTWRDEASNLLPIVDGLDLFAYVLVIILMIIILAGIIIALSMAIRKRTQEIGTLRAIGMSRGGVRRMIVYEAALLAALASALGAAIGAVIVVLASGNLEPPNEAVKIFLLSDTIVLSLDFGAVATAVLVIVGVTGASALIPAYRATRIPPVVAMQSANG